jgi:hypothetical protein
MTTELEQAEQAARDAQYAVVLAEQKLGATGGEWDRIHAQVAETKLELANIPARVRAVDPDNTKGLGRLRDEQGLLEMKLSALLASAERAEKPHQEAVEALSGARAKLDEAESKRWEAEHIQARENLDGLIDKFSESEEVKRCLITLGVDSLRAYVQARASGHQFLTVEEQNRNVERYLDIKFAAEAKEREERDREWRKIKRSATAEGVEVVEPPDGRVDENGVRIVSLSNPEMSYRIAHQVNKQDEEAHRNLGGDES